MLTLQRVLCPIDLSESSRQALIYAKALSSWYEAPLTVLHVCVDLPVFEMASPFGHSASSAVVIEEAQIAERRAAVRTFVWSAVGDNSIDIGDSKRRVPRAGRPDTARVTQRRAHTRRCRFQQARPALAHSLLRTIRRR